MAIFIIDQFSLNTDLPLDIRYVPTLGRLDPDISVYKYPGMQVFDTTTETIWYADNALNWVEVGSGTDASLNEIFNLVIDLSTYITNNVDISINNLYNITNQLDASIERIDVSLNDYGALLAIHDASIGDLYDWVSIFDASIGDIYDYQAIQDGSISANATDILQIEASIGDINAYQTIQDASIKANEDDIAQLDASIVRIDGSINNIYSQQAIQDASITTLDGSVVYLFGQLGADDASLNELYQYNTIQDGSISANTDNITIIDGSITSLTNITNIHDVSIGDLYDITDNLDSSLDLFVAKAGDTMTGALTIEDGGLVVGSIGTPLDVSIYSDLYVHNDVAIGGNLTVDGSLYVTNVETIDVSAAYIHMNTGLTGTPPESMQSGIVIERGSEDPYVFIYDESQQSFRIGIAEASSGTGYVDSSTQAVATREDFPTTNGIAVWNASENRFDTYTELTFDGNVLVLDASLTLSALAGGSNLMLVVTPSGDVIAQSIPNYDASLNELYGDITNIETSLGSLNGLIQTNITDITNLETSVGALDGLIQTNISDITNIETSLGSLDGLIQTNITDIAQLDASIIRIDNELIIIDGSIVRIDGSINDIYTKLIAQDTSVKGAINIGDGSAAVYAGLTADGSLQFREFVGVGAAIVSQSGDLIEISIDASFGGEVNTASNIGTGEGLSVTKEGQDLPFKSIDTNQPSTVILSSDNSTMYIDVSIVSDASLSGLTDVTITPPLDVHQIIEWDSDVSKWVNTNNIAWDTSLGTTTDDLGGIPQGTDLNGLTLKEILYKILYEYQPPTLVTGTDPVSGIYEKGLASTQFATIDVSYLATNANYPLALLNNVHITKTGTGSVYDASLGLVASTSNSFTDVVGITNWGGTSRTISYNVTIDDNVSTESQPAVGSSKSFTFYYRQYWGMVPGTINANQVDSDMIKGLIDSRLAGETTLNANFDNSTGGFVKYLFAYPDTVAAPDNFGTLTQIIDQNDFDITGSWDTETEDVSVGNTNVRYRFYLAKNKVNTADFDISFIF